MRLGFIAINIPVHSQILTDLILGLVIDLLAHTENTFTTLNTELGDLASIPDQTITQGSRNGLESQEGR